MGGWPWPLDAVQGWFESLWHQLVLIENGILGSIQVFISFAVGQVQGFLNVLYNQMWGMGQWLAQQIPDIIGPLRVLYNQMWGMGQWIATTAGTLLDTLYNKVWGGISWLGSQLAGIGGTVVNALSPVLGGFADTIASGFKQFSDFILGGLSAFWGFLTNTVVPTITGAINAAFQFLKDLFVNTFKAFMSILGVHSPIEPEEALLFAIGVAIPAFLINFGIFIAATGSDLLHPLKGTGLVPSAIEIVRSIGPELVTGAIVGSYTGTAIEGPLKLYWNSLARPHRPMDQSADIMYHKGHLSPDDWRKMYRYKGWPDWAIEAWFASMWTEPSDRLLVAMVEDPNVPREWIRQKLIYRGYTPADVDTILAYAADKAVDKTRGNREGLVITRYKEGFISIEELNAELSSFGYRPDQVSKVRAAAAIAADTDTRKELIDIWKKQFQKDLLTTDEFRSNLETIIVDAQQIERIIELEKARKFPIPKRPSV